VFVHEELGDPQKEANRKEADADHDEVQCSPIWGDPRQATSGQARERHVEKRWSQ